MPKIRTIEAGADPSVLAAQIAPQHAADIVELLNALPLERAVGILVDFPHEQAIEVFENPQFAGAAELIQRLPIQQASAVLGEMSADRAADLLRNVNEPARSQLLSFLSPAAAASLRKLLSYPQDTAGSIMTTEIASLPPPWPFQTTTQLTPHEENIGTTAGRV